MEFSEKAKTTFKTSYTPETNIEQLLSIYNAVLKRKAAVTSRTKKITN
jgi:hypothetical protein